MLTIQEFIDNKILNSLYYSKVTQLTKNLKLIKFVSDKVSRIIVEFPELSLVTVPSENSNYYKIKIKLIPSTNSNIINNNLNSLYSHSIFNLFNLFYNKINFDLKQHKDKWQVNLDKIHFKHPIVEINSFHYFELLIPKTTIIISHNNEITTLHKNSFIVPIIEFIGIWISDCHIGLIYQPIFIKSKSSLYTHTLPDLSSSDESSLFDSDIDMDNISSAISEDIKSSA